MSEALLNAGQELKTIPVRFSYRIIELFSEGLYSSPNKAIEELVSNSFDAGASQCHISIPEGLLSGDSRIVVIDDGSGMDADGLEKLWLIGTSYKRQAEEQPKKRKQIGKFGIGKLATFVLAQKLTHLTKTGGQYFAVTMDFAQVPQGRLGSIETQEEKQIELSLRQLSEAEALSLIAGLNLDRTILEKMFDFVGKNAPESWTIAVLSDLKEMAQEMELGRLQWVLENAMPLGDDFALFFNGNQITPARVDEPVLQRWVLDSSILPLPNPSPEEIQAAPDQPMALFHPELGRIEGYIELYERPFPERIGRSHGFFVYVHKRLINIDDSHFGLPSNSLRHGTFSKLRVIVHIDGLDKELRSNRESITDTRTKKLTKDFLKSVFNLARAWQTTYEEEQEPGFQASQKIQQSPGSLTRRPLVGLVKQIHEGKARPKLLRYPPALRGPDGTKVVEEFQNKANGTEPLMVGFQLEELGEYDPIVKFDIQTGIVSINTLHPFVASYIEEFEEDETLRLIGASEILTEAFLYNLGFTDDQVLEVTSRRNELFRQFSRGKRRTAEQIARDLVDSTSNKRQFELEIVAAFNSLGFDARHVGGSGAHDGIAFAPLAADETGARRYSVSLEAKSKQNEGAALSSDEANLSRIIAHRDDAGCDHLVVVAPDFIDEHNGVELALISDARANIALHADELQRTITFIRAVDLARLVRLRPLKNIGLDELRSLFTGCVSPEEAKAWVDNMENRDRPQINTIAVLETIWNEQARAPHEAIEYSQVSAALYHTKGIQIDRSDLIDLCKGLAQICAEVHALERTVELTQNPEIVAQSISANISRLGSAEQDGSILGL